MKERISEAQLSLLQEIQNHICMNSLGELYVLKEIQTVVENEKRFFRRYVDQTYITNMEIMRVGVNGVATLRVITYVLSLEAFIGNCIKDRKRFNCLKYNLDAFGYELKQKDKDV